MSVNCGELRQEAVTVLLLLVLCKQLYLLTLATLPSITLWLGSLCSTKIVFPGKVGDDSSQA